MAVNSFEEALSLVQEPEFKEALEKASEKYPDLKAGWLRQSDYSRKSNERDADVRLAQEWKAWRKDNWDDDLGMTKAEVALNEKIRQAEAEAESLRQARETEMTFEDVRGEVEKMMANRDKGLLTEEAFKQKYGNQLFNKAEYDRAVEDRMNRLAAGLEGLYSTTFQLGFKHKDEFGEVLDPVALVEYANKNGIQDLSKAYDSMIAPRRETIKEEKYKAEIAEAEKRGELKGKQELAMSQGGHMPTDNGAPVMSHLQERILKGRQAGEGKDGAIPDEVKMDGSGRLGHHVAEQFRKDQAAAIA